MRAVLVVNPQATSTTAGGRDVLAHALASEVKLEVVETTHRGHAATIAASAAEEGVDLVVAHGGDGTVNEVVNGMLPADHATSTAGAPMLGVVPGGSANVFARTLGYPTDPVEATHVLLESLIHRRSRQLGLGMAAGRWFTFSAGVGWDADVVAGVDRIRGKHASPALYARVATEVYLRPPLGRPELTLELGGERYTGVRTAFVSNTDPWSYLGERPIRLNPGCSFDAGLGVFALRSLGILGVLSHLRQAMNGKGKQRGRHLIREDSVDTLRIHADAPVNLQVDGDLAGQPTDVVFRSVPRALTVVG